VQSHPAHRHDQATAILLLSNCALTDDEISRVLDLGQRLPAIAGDKEVSRKKFLNYRKSLMWRAPNSLRHNNPAASAISPCASPVENSQTAAMSRRRRSLRQRLAS